MESEFFCSPGRICAELLIEILVSTQIVCESLEKSLVLSHKYFQLPILDIFNQIELHSTKMNEIFFFYFIYLSNVYLISK